MSIITRYLSKQILQITLAVTLVLLTVAVLARALTYLGQASQGQIDPGVLLLLMSYRLPEFIQLILPLALLLGILLAYGRMYAENEMTVLLACGVSKRRLLGISSLTAAAVAILVAVLSLGLTPWGLGNTDKLLEAQEELTEFDIMVPGIFQNISRGERTTYTERMAERVMHNVFMYEAAHKRVIVAEQATPLEDEQGRRFMLFSNGSLSQGEPGGDAYTLTRFSTFGLRMPEREISLSAAIEEQAMSSAELLAKGENKHIAELQWRLSLVVLIPVISLFAVPLSKVSPRQGRFARLLPAILIYVSYFGLLLGSRDMLAKGDLAPVPGLWWVHVLFFLFGLSLYYEWTPKRLFSGRLPSFGGTGQ